MADTDRDKWNQRHREGYAVHGRPSAILAQWIERIPRGRALDLACGSGRNALFLAANGFEVDAVDISDVALDIGRRRAKAAGLHVTWIEQDLDESLTLTDGYTLLLVVRFVDLPLIRRLADKLAPGGMLVTEQHIVTEAAVGGPSDPAFRLQPGALREVAEGLRLLSYEEGIVDDPDRQPMALARLVAQRP